MPDVQITELRRNLRQVIENLSETGRPVVIRRRHHHLATLVPPSREGRSGKPDIPLDALDGFASRYKLRGVLREKHPDIRWNDIAKLKDKLTHHYWTIDPKGQAGGVPAQLAAEGRSEQQDVALLWTGAARVGPGGQLEVLRELHVQPDPDHA